MDIEWPFYLSALAAGGLWGYVTQRGGFCLVRAVSNMVLMGDATILRAYGLALLVAMIGVQALQAGGLVEIPIRPFHWLSNVTGGLIFGAGMMLGGGCSGSTWYRTGEGAVGAWIILLGFALGATAAGRGPVGRADPGQDAVPGAAAHHPPPRVRAHQARNDSGGGAGASLVSVQPASGGGSRLIRPDLATSRPPREAARCAAASSRGERRTRPESENTARSAEKCFSLLASTTFARRCTSASGMLMATGHTS